jgi:hypothetical protein
MDPRDKREDDSRGCGTIHRNWFEAGQKTKNEELTP